MDESTTVMPTKNEAVEVRQWIRDILREEVAGFAGEGQQITKEREPNGTTGEMQRRIDELSAERDSLLRAAAETGRRNAINTALERAGVQKIDLAFRAIQADVRSDAEGRVVAISEGREISLDEYVSSFVAENPELLPARLFGGSGAVSPPRSMGPDINSIRPGMSEAELGEVRAEIARLAALEGMRKV